MKKSENQLSLKTGDGKNYEVPVEGSLGLLTTYCKLILFLACMPFFSPQIQAQVTSDGNVQFQAITGTSVTITNFSVPAGSNSVLVVYSSAYVSVATNVTFGGTPLTQLGMSSRSLNLSIWYLALGDLASPSIGDIVATYATAGAGGAAHTIHAISYQNVNQSTPMSDFAENLFGSGTTSSISVNSNDANDLIVDFIYARADNTSPTLTEGAGQTKIGEQTNQQPLSTFLSSIALSEESSTGSAVSMDWTISSGALSGTSHQVAAKINAISSGSGSTSNDIPTLSEWGLIILALLLMTFGTIYLIQPNFSLRKKRIEE